MAKHQIAYYIIEYKYDDNTTGNLVDMLSRVLTYIHGLEKSKEKEMTFQIKTSLHICRIVPMLTISLK